MTRLTLFLTAFVLVLAGCAGQDAATAPDGSGEVPEALAFEASMVGGGDFDAGDYDGRDVMLWFWAPW